MGFFDNLPIFGVSKRPRVRTPHEIKVRREQGVAGSYNHVVTDHGNLGSNEHVVDMLENGGDVFEAVEEMYGMIWFLAWQATAPHISFERFQSLAYSREIVKDIVETARQNYQEGIRVSKEIHRLSPDQRRS